MGAGGFMSTPSSLSLPTVPFCSDTLFFSTAHSLLLLLLSPFLLLNGPSVTVSVIWLSGPCTNKGIPSLVYKYPHHLLSPLYPFFSCSFLIHPPHHPQSCSLFKRILPNCLCVLICKYIHSWVELNNKFTLLYEHSHVKKNLIFQSFCNSEKVFWKRMTTCSSFSQLLWDGEAEGEWSLLAEAVSVGLSSLAAWQICCMMLRQGVCYALVFVCVSAHTGLWDWYQCHSQLISGYLQDVATLICHHHWHFLDLGVQEDCCFSIRIVRWWTYCVRD